MLPAAHSLAQGRLCGGNAPSLSVTQVRCSRSGLAGPKSVSSIPSLHPYLARPPHISVQNLQSLKKWSLSSKYICRSSQSESSPSDAAQHTDPPAAQNGPPQNGPPQRLEQTTEAKLVSLCQTLTNLFPVWMVLTGIGALTAPWLFTWFSTKYLTWGLALTMLGMGFTMTLSDFTDIFTRTPYLLLLGLVLQYSIMPSLGYLISKFAGLAQPLAIGVILVSCCPGGTASNIVAYIAKGELTLSVMMTTASTFGAIVATPLLTAWLAGTLVPVDAYALFVSTLQVVLAPVILGASMNRFFPSLTSRIAQFSPLLATLLVCLIVGSTLAHNVAALSSTGPSLLVAVVALHACGFSLGYAFSKMLNLSEPICRTNSIEVGMQNSTLGAVLATLHFSDPLVAAPCALSACTHATMGSLLAAYWRAQPLSKGATSTAGEAGQHMQGPRPGDSPAAA